MLLELHILCFGSLSMPMQREKLKVSPLSGRRAYPGRVTILSATTTNFPKDTRVRTDPRPSVLRLAAVRVSGAISCTFPWLNARFLSACLLIKIVWRAVLDRANIRASPKKLAIILTKCRDLKAS